MELQQLEPFAVSILQKAGVLPPKYDHAYLRSALAIVKEKIKVGRELPEWMSYFFDEDFAFDEAAAKKVFTPEGLANLGRLHERLGKLDQQKFDALHLESEFKMLAGETNQKTGALVHPARLAVSGKPVGPSLYHLLEMLGKARVLTRFERAQKQFATPAA